MAEREPAGAGPVLCPSSRCEPGNLLIGLVQANGEVQFFPDRIRVTAGFAETALRGRRPEARFRFSSACCKSGCSKWTGTGCGVAAKAASLSTIPAIADDPRPLPNCSIRSQCRWFGEYGGSICKTCRWVITERDAAFESEQDRATTSYAREAALPGADIENGI